MFSKNNPLWFQKVLVIFLVSVVFVIPTSGDDTYTDFTPAGLTGYMTSQTVALTPADRTRTTIGIGEEVDCSIESCTWEDRDCKNDTEIVYDTIGDRVWACSSGGTVDPSGVTTSDTTRFTADKTPNPAVTVSVYVYDTPLYHDDVSPPYITKTRTFEVIAPLFVATTWLWDPTNIWIDWVSGDKYLAALSYFKLTVNPTTVSFYRASIRENFGDGETDTWPDDSTWYGPTGIEGPATPTQANSIPDVQSTHFHNSDRLYTGSEWQDFTPNCYITYEYEDDVSGWTPFDTGIAQRCYYESDRTTKVGVSCADGGLQGPFQEE